MPVELLYFEGDNYEIGNVLKWKTESENNNDYFDIEWTTTPETDGTWVNIKTVEAVGTTTNQSSYGCLHTDYRRNVINYYRLSQTDNDGSKENLGIIAINNNEKYKEVLKIFNSLGQEVTLDTKGIIYIMYADGKMERKFNN